MESIITPEMLMEAFKPCFQIVIATALIGLGLRIIIDLLVKLITGNSRGSQDVTITVIHKTEEKRKVKK